MADKDFKVKSGLSLGTPLPVSMGGTGQTSTTNTLNALLPNQTGNSGKALSTDGSSTSWVAFASSNNATMTGAFVIPSGTTAERPGSPAVGYTWYNTTLGVVESYHNLGWVAQIGRAHV